MTMHVRNSAWYLELTIFFSAEIWAYSSSLNCWPYRVRNRGLVVVGGKRIQLMFPCFSCHTRPVSEGSCNNSGGKSHGVCLAPSGGSQSSCQEMAWRRALSFMSFSVFPDVSGSSLWSSFRFCVIGSPLLKLLFPLLFPNWPS